MTSCTINWRQNYKCSFFIFTRSLILTPVLTAWRQYYYYFIRTIETKKVIKIQFDTDNKIQLIFINISVKNLICNCSEYLLIKWTCILINIKKSRILKVLKLKIWKFEKTSKMESASINVIINDRRMISYKNVNSPFNGKFQRCCFTLSSKITNRLLVSCLLKAR